MIPVNLNVQYTDNVVESKFKAEVFDSEVKSYDTIEEQLEDENDTEIQSAKDYIAGQEELAEAIRKEQLEISEQTKRELLEESRIAEEIRKEEYVEPVVITTPTETNSGGFTIGELLGEKLQGAINENYKTEDVVSPIESHYSAAPETKAEDEIPTLIIHPRNENTEEEKLEEY